MSRLTSWRRIWKTQAIAWLAAPISYGKITRTAGRAKGTDGSAIRPYHHQIAWGMLRFFASFGTTGQSACS